MAGEQYFEQDKEQELSLLSHIPFLLCNLASLIFRDFLLYVVTRVTSIVFSTAPMDGAQKAMDQRISSAPLPLKCL